MYCSTCGTPVIENLNYCKNCGARIGSANASAANNLSEASFNTLVAGVIALPIAGIGVIIGLLVVMKQELGFVDPMILIVTIVSFMMLLVAELTLIRLLLRHTKTDKETKIPANLNDVVIKNLSGAQTRSLYEPTQEPIPSVVENTTRHLEPVPREPKMQ